MRDISIMPLYQSDKSHNATLAELKRRVETGVGLSACDDNRRGSKNTECTLGLCDDSIKEMRDGVYARPDGRHNCPHDARYFGPHGHPIPHPPEINGCFWTCRIFQKKYRKGDPAARIKMVGFIDEIYGTENRE